MSVAIRNRKTRKFVYGTDYRYHPAHQFTSEDRAIIYESWDHAEVEFRARECGKSYEIVPVRIEVLED